MGSLKLHLKAFFVPAQLRVDKYSLKKNNFIDFSHKYRDNATIIRLVLVFMQGNVLVEKKVFLQTSLAGFIACVANSGPLTSESNVLFP